MGFFFFFFFTNFSSPNGFFNNRSGYLILWIRGISEQKKSGFYSGNLDFWKVRMGFSKIVRGNTGVTRPELTIITAERCSGIDLMIRIWPWKMWQWPVTTQPVATGLNILILIIGWVGREFPNRWRAKPMRFVAIICIVKHFKHC